MIRPAILGLCICATGVLAETPVAHKQLYAFVVNRYAQDFADHNHNLARLEILHRCGEDGLIWDYAGKLIAGEILLRKDILEALPTQSIDLDTETLDLLGRHYLEGLELAAADQRLDLLDAIIGQAPPTETCAAAKAFAEEALKTE